MQRLIAVESNEVLGRRRRRFASRAVRSRRPEDRATRSRGCPCGTTDRPWRGDMLRRGANSAERSIGRGPGRAVGPNMIYCESRDSQSNRQRSSGRRTCDTAEPITWVEFKSITAVLHIDFPDIDAERKTALRRERVHPGCDPPIIARPKKSFRSDWARVLPEPEMATIQSALGTRQALDWDAGRVWGGKWHAHLPAWFKGRMRLQDGGAR